MINMNNIFKSHRQIYLFALLTSLLLSVLIGYRHTVINPDGICYLLSAQVLNFGSMHDVMHFCPQAKWPFYSALIYGVARITHFPYEIAAYLLNGLLSLISVITFIKIIEKLGGNQRVMWLAALVILFAHQFNVLRDNIIRDHGFWAFYLVSIYLLLEYFHRPRLNMALLWNASLLLATLFRIEGAIFLFTMPFIAWFSRQSFSARLKSFLSLNSVFMVACVALVLWHFTHPDQSAQQWGRVGEIIHQLQNGLTIITDRYHSVRAILMQHVFPAESLSDASVVVFLVWINWYLYNVVLTLGMGYSIFLLYAWFTRAAHFTSQNAWIVWGYVVVNTIMTMGFLAENLFVSKRYLVALTLVLILWIPFAINQLINKWTSLRHRLFLTVMAIIFLVSAISGVVEFGRSKYYVRTAGNWMATEIPADAKIYMNDLQLIYYSNHYGMHIFEVVPQTMDIKTVVDGKWKQYDYLALRLRKKDNSELTPLLKELQDISPMKIFNDKQGNRVAVYKIMRAPVTLSVKQD